MLWYNFSLPFLIGTNDKIPFIGKALLIIGIDTFWNDELKIFLSFPLLFGHLIVFWSLIIHEKPILYDTGFDLDKVE